MDNENEKDTQMVTIRVPKETLAAFRVGYSLTKMQVSFMPKGAAKNA